MTSVCAAAVGSLDGTFMHTDVWENGTSVTSIIEEYISCWLILVLSSSGVWYFNGLVMFHFQISVFISKAYAAIDCVPNEAWPPTCTVSCRDPSCCQIFKAQATLHWYMFYAFKSLKLFSCIGHFLCIEQYCTGPLAINICAKHDVKLN